MRHLRALLVIAIALPAAGGLSACGGGGGGGEDPKEIIEQTFKGGKDIESAVIDFSLTFSAEGVKELEKPVTVKLGGPFQSEGKNKLPQFDLDLQANAAGQSFSAGAVSTGDKGYVKFQGTNYVADDSTFNAFKAAFESAAKQGSGGKQPSLAKLGINPKRWLKDPKNEGDEDVGGAQTVHISSGVDLSAMLTDINKVFGQAASMGLGGLGGGNVPSEIPAEVRKQIEEAVEDVSFDVWSGKEDKILRKFELALKFEVPESLRGQAGGLEGGDLKLSLTLNEVGKKQEISAPEDPKPLSELLGGLGGLGGLLGGAGGGAGGTPGAGSTPGGGAGGGAKPSGSGDVDKYADCIQSADNAGALEKCAELLK